VSAPGPRRLVVVVGTATEVGKTWVAARLLAAWRRAGRSVAARKPAQSFEAGRGPTDAEVLATASGEAPEQVCPAHRWYPVPMAPPMAADVLGRPPFGVADLVEEVEWPRTRVDVGLVELAGGVCSPQADDGDAVAVTSLLRPDVVVVVADAGLGAVNAVRQSAVALAGVVGPTPPAAPELAVVLNRFDPTTELHRRNLDWLRGRDGLTVLAGDPAGLEGLARGLAEADEVR
jgi:dethiobiotin synthetase